VWRSVWVVDDGAYHPATDRYVIERFCDLHDRWAPLLADMPEADEEVLQGRGTSALW
jgi:hypothetical protein